MKTINRETEKSNFFNLKLFNVVINFLMAVIIARFANAISFSIEQTKFNDLSIYFCLMFFVIVFSFFLVSINGYKTNNNAKISISILSLFYILIIGTLLEINKTYPITQTIGFSYLWLIFIINISFLFLILFVFLIFKSGFKFIFKHIILAWFVLLLMSPSVFVSKLLYVDQLNHLFEMFSKKQNWIWISLLVLLFLGAIILIVITFAKVNKKLFNFFYSNKFKLKWELIVSGLSLYFVDNFDFALFKEMDSFSYIAISIGFLTLLSSIFYILFAYKYIKYYIFRIWIDVVMIFSLSLLIIFVNAKPDLEFRYQEILFMFVPIILAIILTSYKSFAFSSGSGYLFTNFLQYILVLCFLFLGMNINDLWTNVWMMKNFISLDIILLMLLAIMTILPFAEHVIFKLRF